MNQENNQLPPIEIPATSLSKEALNGMIDAFIMREGTDYGINEVSHEAKFKQIQKQIESGRVRIVFDPNTDSATLMTETDFKKLEKLFHR
jgi:uncharacterized protein YheU (UPF0270 family)